MGFLEYGSGTGSDFSFTSYIADTRIYRPIRENTVLAAQLYGQFTAGNPPFNMLSSSAARASCAATTWAAFATAI